MTQPIIKVINQSKPDANLITLAADILNNHGIIVAPTETRYGLLASIDSDDAINRIFELKKRPRSLPTAIFVRSKEEIGRFGHINSVSACLSDRFLPGPFTLVLKAEAAYPAPVVVDEKIGIRFSSSPVVSSILSQTKSNLTATSANLSGDDEPVTIPEIVHYFGSGVDLYLDAGPLVSKASTVVDCSSENYRILREGIISKAEISTCLRGIL
jgi:L-threonylcarbamoyladenylate synthase